MFWNISPAEPGPGGKTIQTSMIATKINQPFFHRVSDENLGLQRRFSFFLWPSQAYRWTKEVAYASHVSKSRVLEMVIPVFIWARQECSLKLNMFAHVPW